MYLTFEGRGSQRLDQRLQEQLNSIAADLTDECEVCSCTILVEIGIQKYSPVS